MHAVKNKDTYDPYSISKVLRYLYAFNDGSETAMQVYQALGERFITTISLRLQTIQNMPFDDALIDIDVKDLVDIVRVYSSFSKS